LLTLAAVEAGEQHVFRLELGFQGAVEQAAACGAERDEMAAAVVVVALAGNEPRIFEGVEQGHEDARVDVHLAAKLYLTEGSIRVKQAKQLKLARLQVVGRVRVAQRAHGVLPKQREEQAGTGPTRVQNAHIRGGCSGSSHDGSISRSRQ
jgi:hypothetical protein